MPYETPKHLGRFQAASPFQSQESLDSRRGRTLDDYPLSLRDSGVTNSLIAPRDVSRSAVPADDEADHSGDNGPYDLGFE